MYNRWTNYFHISDNKKLIGQKNLGFVPIHPNIDEISLLKKCQCRSLRSSINKLFFSWLIFFKIKKNMFFIERH
jgi:hypothetical protein